MDSFDKLWIRVTKQLAQAHEGYARALSDFEITDPRVQEAYGLCIKYLTAQANLKTAKQLRNQIDALYEDQECD